ncbi:MAG: FAD-binding oxidoreductase [Flavobacteriales bacterium]|nr:FAD-binding oxidoreductase [Flavobacteriales bacterium]
MMDLRSGLPYHWIRNGLPHTYPKLTADHRCDALVIGGGITGALCAHALAQAGVDTTVIEARSIGTASTSASTALLQYEIDTPMHRLAEMVGMDDAVASFRSCRSAVEELIALGEELIPEMTARRYSVQYASTKSDLEDLRKEAELRTAHGFSVELLDSTGLSELLGIRKSGALVSRIAAEVDPYALTHALMQRVIADGGAVYDRTRMETFDRDGEHHRITTTEGHVIHAKHLIMATGYDSQQYLSEPVAELDSTYAVVSTRMDREILWADNCLIWETATPYLYMRTTPDGRAMIGGLDEPFRDPKRRDALLDRKTDRLTRAFKELMPGLPFEPEYSWCGTFGSSKDGLPYIDRDPGNGAWFVLGMGGNGITFSQVGARIMRDVVTGVPSREHRLFRFDR